MLTKKTKLNLRHIVILLIVVSLSCSCAARIPHAIVSDYKNRIPTSIAVLLVQNETTDMDAPKSFRPRLFNLIMVKGYKSLTTAVIDSKLALKDIREAGQLGSMTPQEIGKYLNVDALLYTTVTEWSTTYLVVYSSMKVGARFQLIDAKTGEQLWESEQEVAGRKFGLDDDVIGDAFAFAAFQAYDPYVEQVINTAFSTLPNGPNSLPSEKGGCLQP